MKIACFFENDESRKSFVKFYNFIGKEKQIGSNFYYVSNKTTDNLFNELEFLLKNEKMDKIVIFASIERKLKKDLPKVWLKKINVVRSPIRFVRATRLPDTENLRSLLLNIMKLNIKNLEKKEAKSISIIEIRNYLVSQDYVIKLFENREKRKRKYNVREPVEKTIDEDLCVICQDNGKSVVILNCRHLCLCGECANNKSLKKCPLCRSEILTFLDVYL